MYMWTMMNVYMEMLTVLFACITQVCLANTL